MIKISLGWLRFSLMNDYYSSWFLFILLVISSSVYAWSYYYMDSEEQYKRFFYLIVSFIISIVILIVFRNLIGAFVGWDCLGVTSFLLVIYYKNRKSLGSGIITALTNRLGDCFFFVFLALSISREKRLCSFTILLLLTAITKSAQIPFRSWLPSAIAAPTPVSALVHSSTLVTAGVYLILRFNYASMMWILPVGSLTMVIAGICACAELDIKKIVALSTLSQLGVMMVSISVYQKELCFFHLFTHALFKALIFMSVGICIHSFYGSQDFRRFSNSRLLPWASSYLLVSSFSLIGIPFLSGFYRKDLVLESIYRSGVSMTGWFLFLAGICLTASYRMKMAGIIINDKAFPCRIHRGGFRISVKVPTFFLGMTSIVRGFCMGPSFFVGISVIPSRYKTIPLLAIALGTWLRTRILRNLFRSMIFMSSIFQRQSYKAVSIQRLSLIDTSWVEKIGPGVIYVSPHVTMMANRMIIIGIYFILAITI